jgi:hypothetical protein
MKEKWHHIFKQDNCPTIEELVLYHQGKTLSGRTFEIENHLAGCEICADILEGLTIIDDPEKIKNAEKAIRVRLREYLKGNQNKKIIFSLYRRLAVAASILILVSSGILLFFLKNEHQQLFTEKLEEAKPISHAKQDTLVILAEKTTIKLPKERRSEKSSGKAAKSISNEIAIEEVNPPAANTEINEERGTNAEEPIQPENINSELTNDKAKDVSAEKPSMYVMQNAAPAKTEQGNKMITGKILAEDGNPLPGATVLIKGTTQGTVSDINGNFKLEVPVENSVLVVSFVGYLSEEIPVENDNLKVELLADVSKLDEVVVVGYGTQKKSLETGAVSRITSDELNNRPRDWEEQEPKRKASERKKNSSLQIIDLRPQTDSLKNILNIHQEDRASRIALIKMYLEISSQPDALRELEVLQSQTKSGDQLKIIQDIISFTRESKYGKALQNLNRMKY